MIQSMFHLQQPLLEKVLRPVVVYLCLIAFLRLFGKRELAQLNPFDLVVLLSLSNTVQNAIIGDDNSVTGGIIGAFSLLAINWVLMRLLFNLPRLNNALQGSPNVLIRNGVVDEAALKAESLTRPELISALHRDSITSLAEVERCTLEPNGTFFVERTHPTPAVHERQQILAAVAALTAEVRDLREQLALRP